MLGSALTEVSLFSDPWSLVRSARICSNSFEVFSSSFGVMSKESVFADKNVSSDSGPFAVFSEDSGVWGTFRGDGGVRSSCGRISPGLNS